MTYHGNISFYLLQFKQIKKKEVFFDVTEKNQKEFFRLQQLLALVCTGISLPDSNVAKAAKRQTQNKENIIKVGKKKKIAISGK